MRNELLACIKHTLFKEFSGSTLYGLQVCLCPCRQCIDGQHHVLKELVIGNRINLLLNGTLDVPGLELLDLRRLAGRSAGIFKQGIQQQLGVAGCCPFVLSRQISLERLSQLDNKDCQSVLGSICCLCQWILGIDGRQIGQHTAVVVGISAGMEDMFFNILELLEFHRLILGEDGRTD